MTASNEAPASGEDSGFRVAALFFGLLILAALMFALYVLLWNGGAHT